MRRAYRLLSLLTTARAAGRGPLALIANLLRRSAHRLLARLMR